MRKLAVIILIVLNQTAFAQFDSVNISVALPPSDMLSALTEKLDSIDASVRGRIDSVAQYYHEATSKIQALSSRCQQKIDSLSKLKLPTEKYMQNLDSLNHEIVEVKQKLEGKIQSIKQKATEKINAIPLPPELEAKASELTASLERLNLNAFASGIRAPIDLNDINDSFDQIIPSADIKSISNLSSELPSINVQDVGENLGSVSDLAAGVNEQTGELQNSTSEITQGVSNVNSLDKLAEDQAMKLDVIKDFTKEAGNLPTTLIPTEGQAKQQALEQVQSIAVDHFADKQEALQSAMNKIAKYKRKFPSVNSLSDITKRPPNPMKGRPMIERIVPGLQFQIFQKQGNLLTDINLYAGYRINGRITTGIGWNQRVAYNLDADKFNPRANVFGPRAFGELKLGMGFSPRVEIEMMNMLIPSFASQAKTDDQNREWVVSGLVGIKKDYRFYKNIKGTTMIMLNVFHPHNKSPYPDWLNLRFGFEFPIQKKARKA